MRKTGPSHPGAIIRAEMDARGWTTLDLSLMLGTTAEELDTILSGKREITHELADAFGSAFDVTPVFFRNLQVLYNLAMGSDLEAWLRAEAEKCLTEANWRRRTAKLLLGCSVDRIEAQRLAAKMTGRKIAKTSSSQDAESAKMSQNIADRKEADSDRLIHFADFVRNYAAKMEISDV